MSRIKIEEFTSQDDLPPEIRRRVQVEELWARRNVLAVMMNAERLRTYAERRTDLAAGCAPMEVVPKYKLTTRTAMVVPMKQPWAPTPVQSSS
jgi:hypothetical protein